MAHNRTRLAKERAAKRRLALAKVADAQVTQESFSAESVAVATPIAKKLPTFTASDVLGYPVQLVYRDLIKTLVVTLVLLLSLVAVVWIQKM